MRRHGAVAMLLALAAVTMPWSAGAAQDEPERANIWDIYVGMPVSEVPWRDFIDISCGTNGGPPSLPLAGFGDFARCPQESTGLHEVTFQYDDEVEYWARANEYLTWIALYAGTKMLDQLVILSVLVDEAAVVRGIRIITDPSAEPRMRRLAVVMATQLKGRFGDGEWICVDLPQAPGENPIGRRFVKERCTKTTDDEMTLFLSANFFHKPGQDDFDQHTGAQQLGYFESSTRLEIYDAAAAPPPPWTEAE